MPADPPHPFVSRGGLKLAHALDAFELSVEGFTCADLGCSTGGFTDVLLRRGASRVVAVDTAYGVLDYRLRTNPRVRVMERTNALHASPPADIAAGGVDLVVIDAGWTSQKLIIPAAVRWLGGSRTPDLSPRRSGSDVPVHPDAQANPDLRRASGPASRGAASRGAAGLVITLVKPHYELDAAEKRTLLRQGVLEDADAQRIAGRVIDQMSEWGVTPLAVTKSPIAGSKGNARGNAEWVVVGQT